MCSSDLEGGSELGEGLWGVGVEEGMEVHVKGQGQAMGSEGAGEEVETAGPEPDGSTPKAGKPGSPNTLWIERLHGMLVRLCGDNRVNRQNASPICSHFLPPS